MSEDDNKKAMDRLAKACRVVIRQWEGRHPPGNDAILELHRSLKMSIPGLERNNLSLKDAELKLSEVIAASDRYKAALEELVEIDSHNCLTSRMLQKIAKQALENK